jgi:hypothetical protein
MPLQIPDQDIPKIIKIRKLSGAQTEELIRALESAPIEVDSHRVVNRIAKFVRSVPKKDLTAIIEVIYGLYFVREFANVSQSVFLSDLLESIQQSKDPALVLAANEVAEIEKRFERLLSIETIHAVSKSVRLQRDGERIYCTSKILSDIRPVFKNDAAVRPIGAVITHTLKLDYHNDADGKEFFVVLDGQDLIALKEVLDRALAKDKTLRELLRNIKLSELGT